MDNTEVLGILLSIPVDLAFVRHERAKLARNIEPATQNQTSAKQDAKFTNVSLVGVPEPTPPDTDDDDGDESD